MRRVSGAHRRLCWYGARAGYAGDDAWVERTELCHLSVSPVVLTVSREEFVEPALRRPGDAVEPFGDPGLWIDIVELGGADQGVRRRRAPANPIEREMSTLADGERAATRCHADVRPRRRQGALRRGTDGGPEGGVTRSTSRRWTAASPSPNSRPAGRRPP